MRLIADFKSIHLDLVAYDRALLSSLRNLNERAGQAWVKAAVDSTPIPTWSGASRATFQKLASELGTSVPIGQIRASKSRVELGKSVSSGSGVVEERSTGKTTFVGFKYETDLRYLRYNEYNRATKGPPPQPYSDNVRFTPYNFQKRAAAAWVAEAAKAKLPNPFRYLRTRSI